MSEDVWRKEEVKVRLVSHLPSRSLCFMLKVVFSLSLLLNLRPGDGLLIDRLSSEVSRGFGAVNGAEDFQVDPVRREEEDLELTQEIAIFAPPAAEQTKYISYLEEMQVNMEETTHVINEGGDDSWVPAVSGMVIVLIVFSISVFACCLHCPFCCIYRMNDPQRIV